LELDLVALLDESSTVTMYKKLKATVWYNETPLQRFQQPTLIYLYPSYHAVLVADSDCERACKIIFHVPRSGCSLHFVLASYSKDRSSRQLHYDTTGSYAHTITMERLFSPCTRLRDIRESQDPPIPQLEGRTELLQELNLDVSTEEFLSAERAFTYADLYAMFGSGEAIAWLTPHTAVTLVDGRARQSWEQLHGSTHRINFNADGKEIIAWARSNDHLLEICDVIVRVLAASVVYSVQLNNRTIIYHDLINAPTLTYLMEKCRSLKSLSLHDLRLDEHHCRVLGVYSRPGLEIELKGCKLTSAGTSALAEVLGRNQGPTKLDYCDIDCSVLADGLRGNSRLKCLHVSRLYFEFSNRQILAIADAVQENKGLVDLMFHRFSLNDETWAAICTSLDTHPTLEVLNFFETFDHTSMTPTVVTFRIQALLNMLKVNTSIHTIHLDDHYSQHELYRGSIIPYLATNRLRPRLLAIQKSRPIAYRAKLLGRALVSVRTDANGVWMLLSGNAEVAFATRATTVAAAVNPPTPAATAPSTTYAAAVAAPVMSALTTTATGSLHVAAAAAAISTPTTARGLKSIQP
jgi:hypothetical protein